MDKIRVLKPLGVENPACTIAIPVTLPAFHNQGVHHGEVQVEVSVASGWCLAVNLKIFSEGMDVIAEHSAVLDGESNLQISAPVREGW